MDPDGPLILPRLINLVLAIYLLLCLSYFFFIRVLVLCSFPSPLCVSFLLPSLLLLLPLQPILLILLESPSSANQSTPTPFSRARVHRSCPYVSTFGESSQAASVRFSTCKHSPAHRTTHVRTLIYFQSASNLLM